jgi:hypothetical protein
MARQSFVSYPSLKEIVLDIHSDQALAKILQGELEETLHRERLKLPILICCHFGTRIRIHNHGFGPILPSIPTDLEGVNVPLAPYRKLTKTSPSTELVSALVNFVLFLFYFKERFVCPVD